ncbi:hypothetical protein B0H12DRAFT_1221126 [Mycena haematopus]|nr:hypothetical protein B0H12DRAFT_1221126 [Mycena haematopus]
MNSTPAEDVPPPIDKGKRRAEDPTERTPLLASSSTLDPDPPPNLARRRLLSKLTAIFLGTLLLSTLALALLAWSYASRASHVSADDILTSGLVFEGPDRVDVRNVTSSGALWVSVEARVGLDAGAVLGVNPGDDGLLSGVWKGIGRWGVRRLDRVSVTMSAITLTSAAGDVLATIEPAPLVVPLSAGPPPDASWLTRIETTVLIRPTANASALVHFVREAWAEGSVAVRADVGSVEVRGGALGEAGWRGVVHSVLSDVRTALRIEIPPIPNLPPTSPLPSLSSLITLHAFSVSSSPDSTSLDLSALATLPNPLPPALALSVPALPFTIFLPTPPGEGDPLPFAAVSTAPFGLTHPNITLSITGSVLPLPASPPNSNSSSPSSPTNNSSSSPTSMLSTLLTNYLSGLPSPLLVSSPHLPFLGLVPLSFPAPHPRPRVLRDVTIHDMAIKPSAGWGASVMNGSASVQNGSASVQNGSASVMNGSESERGKDGSERWEGKGAGGFTASGTIYARIVLPRGMRVALHVGRVLPDVLVFDGEVPEEDELYEGGGGGGGDAFLPASASWPIPGGAGWPIRIPIGAGSGKGKGKDGGKREGKGDPPPAPPLPTPLPPRAFARIRPEDWLVAQSGPVPDEGGGDPSEPSSPGGGDEGGDGGGGDNDNKGEGEEGGDGSAYVVTAKIVDAPLEVLPGRQKEFRGFVSKVIFGTTPAVAGILGSASVAVDIFGLGSGEVELHGLPVRGRVLVGGK